jgi:hypothetical protein
MYVDFEGKVFEMNTLHLKSILNYLQINTLGKKSTPGDTRTGLGAISSDCPDLIRLERTVPTNYDQFPYSRSPDIR